MLDLDLARVVRTNHLGLFRDQNSYNIRRIFEKKENSSDIRISGFAPQKYTYHTYGLLLVFQKMSHCVENFEDLREEFIKENSKEHSKILKLALGTCFFSMSITPVFLFFLKHFFPD